VLALAALTALFGGCARPPDEVRIRAEIEAMKTAAEARRAGDLLEGIADDFTGNRGEFDREGLARLVKLEFLRNESVGVALGPIAIEVNGDRAVARFDVTLSDASRRWLPGGRDAFAIVSGWRREGSQWVCYNATWTEKE
jgi:hypothetical protein